MIKLFVLARPEFFLDCFNAEVHEIIGRFIDGVVLVTDVLLLFFTLLLG